MSDPKLTGYAVVSGRIRDGQMPRRKLVIGPDGAITGLYDDSLLGIGDVVSVTRASHVEWSQERLWHVVLSDDPRNGAYAEILIGTGFKTRAEALAREVAWLQENILK